MADNDKNQASEQSQEEQADTINEASTDSPASVPQTRDEAVRAQEPTEEPKKASKPVSANLEQIIEKIEKLSVLELADLVHALEDKFGVSAQAPVAVGPSSGPAGSGQTAGEPQEEQTTFNVILSSAGANKIGAIKAVRELVPTLGLKEAKDLVEAAPKVVLEGVNKQTAEEAKAKLAGAGAQVELQ